MTKLAEEYADKEAGPHPGVGHPGEPLWHRTFMASRKAYLAGLEAGRKAGLLRGAKIAALNWCSACVLRINDALEAEAEAGKEKG